MNRKEYLERLEQLLLVLPYEEREEALQYYNDYFDDAGSENEADVIRELGSPEEVVAKIRAGYAGEYGEYSEQGYEDARFYRNQEIMVDPTGVNSDWEGIPKEEAAGAGYRTESKERKSNTNVWKVIAIILLVLLASPIIVPLSIAGIAVLFAIVVAIFAVIFSLGVSGFAILFAGIVVIVAGLAKVMLAPAVGILAAGVGCILLAIGILLSWAIISVFIKVVPGMIRGMVKVLRIPFRKAGVK